VEIAESGAAGRPREYCRRSHRQRAFEARESARRHRLGADEVIISRASYDQVRDSFYRIETALDDVLSDLAAGESREALSEAFWHLYEAAAAVRGIPLEPRAMA
jgi:hypothetical protein